MSLPYYCKRAAETEYCVAARKEKLKPCGYIGITETECMNVYKCCYDQRSDVGIGQCFRPAKPGNRSRMILGVSLGVTLGVLVIGGIILILFAKRGKNKPEEIWPEYFSVSVHFPAE